MWKIAKATYREKHAEIMDNLKKENESTFNWLSAEAHRFWCKSHFKTETKCDILVNNICEGFNRAILVARSLPIIGMLEWLRIYMTLRMQSKREWARKANWEVCPKMHKRIERYSEKAVGYSCMYAAEGKFQINCSGNEQSIVDLISRTSTCRKWNLTGIPCSHAIRAITDNREQAEKYLSNWYKRETYLAAYEPVIYPINGQEMWPKTNLAPTLPPHFRIQPSRPQKARRMGHDSPLKKNKRGSVRLRRHVGKGVNKCGHCRERGYNKKSCPLLAQVNNQAGPQVHDDDSQSRQNHISEQDGPQVFNGYSHSRKNDILEQVGPQVLNDDSQSRQNDISEQNGPQIFNDDSQSKQNDISEQPRPQVPNDGSHPKQSDISK